MNEAQKKPSIPPDPLVLLKESPPFLFLENEEQQQLADKMIMKNYSERETVLDKNNPDNDHIFLVATGSIMTYRDSQLINVIKHGHFFGEQQVILDQDYSSDFIAMKDTTCYLVHRDDILSALRKSKIFAEAFGTILRDDQGIFSAFEDFTVNIIRNTNSGEFSIDRVLPLYRKLSPALHMGINSESIDFTALNYAVKRLPVNLTSTFAYLLTDDLPTEFPDPSATFEAIATPARRRNVWEMLPGKNMVLIRSGMSDLFDIITCLCVYAVEAKKMRLHLHNPKLISLLQKELQNENPNTAAILKKLHFSREDINGLTNVWGGRAAVELNKIVRHRERISVHVRRRVLNYNSRRMEIWTKQIGFAAKELFGYLPNELPDDHEVHIISSNSHSVTNCLNPGLITAKDEVLLWARNKNLEILNEQWYNSYDLLYALSRPYLNEFPDRFSENGRGKKQGVVRLKETASTGIEVQLFDLRKFCGENSDPGISPVPKDRKIVLINIDYAFGEQAEDIIRNLIFLFGRNLKSVNIMGKAGSLVGNRGDVLLPSGFIEQTSDTFHPVTNTVLQNYENLKKRLPERDVYTGQLLTVAGTLMQNKTMLNFYHNLWNCVGLEMEGFYYYRQILKSMQLGVLPENINLRFLYYVSDLPLEKGVSLSAPLLASEGTPPLYAITRFILSSIFNGSALQ
ncbi:MAG: cyclic nucleotide-binding domain-containing protein [Spirochaetales bacterium]|nr:cyclic nucleotide-binding domain-containing protein [Spirochaetales bacterium]